LKGQIDIRTVELEYDQPEKIPAGSLLSSWDGSREIKFMNFFHGFIPTAMQHNLQAYVKFYKFVVFYPLQNL
jgi:hypothetical protein